MKSSPLILLLIAGLLVAGCKTTEPTIKTLAKKEINLEEPEISPVEKAEVIARYRQFVESAKASPLYGEAMRRLADLELEVGEEKNLAVQDELADPGKDKLQESIRLYTTYLENYPKQPDNDLILYQLAKAYALNGEPEKALQSLNRLAKDYPRSRYIDEVYFRRGELMFVFGDYAGAADSYKSIVGDFLDSIYYERALYKYGWSLFKQDKYRQALDAYLAFLDYKYNQGKINDYQISPDLPRADRELLEDTLRVVSLAYTYQNGAKSLKQYFQEVGHRAYEPLIYKSLGDLYLRKERLTDAADTYLAFVQNYPESRFAPKFHSAAIDAYKKGGFAKLVLSSKETFVKLYGVNSQFWLGQDEASRAELKPLLTMHIKELANHYHALAKKTKKAGDFKQAAYWYDVYLKSFPDDENAPYINFLLAESLFDAHQYARAVEEYERTAYTYMPHKQQAEAAYAAILAYNEVDRQLAKSGKNSEERKLWRINAIDSALKFSNTFPNDKRVPAVLVNTAEELYNIPDYPRASHVAMLFLQKDIPRQLRGKDYAKLHRTALTVYGHAEFEQQHYAKAESAYKMLLPSLSKKDKQYKAISDRLAASIYKQGEQARDKGELDLAAYQFLRVAKVVPASSLVAAAQYDGATMLIQAGKYKEAIPVLENFRRTMPKGHKFQAGVTEKLALAYSQTGQGIKAATEMLTLASMSGNPQYQREVMLQAAALYEKSGAPKKAVSTYKQYVKKYPQPLEAAIEARHNIAEYYRKVNKPKEWGYWLSEIVRADSRGGKQRTARTNYLAARASLNLATPYRTAYNKVRLTVPLKKSLKKKKKLMKKAISAYERVIKYKVAEVTTAATYQIAEIYNNFGRALMRSQRPRGLNAEEMEQYDMLLEEQAYPFEEKAIDIHVANLARFKEGIYDKWVNGSLRVLSKMMPARYAKTEKIQSYVEAIN